VWSFCLVDHAHLVEDLDEEQVLNNWSIEDWSLPGGGLWHIYALSADGQGGEFSVRCYVKDGIVSLKDVPGASLSELNAYL